MRLERGPFLALALVLFACGGSDDSPDPEPEPEPTAPETILTGQPSSLTASDSAQISFSSTSTPPPGLALAFECAADGATTYLPCTSPVTRTGLASGSYSLSVRARWAGGAVDETPAEASWTVDRSAPDTTITAGASGDVAPVASTFTFSSSESGATFECRVAPAAYAPCTSPLTLPVALGDHELSVRAIDKVGNVDPSPATRSYRGILPDTRIDSSPSSPTAADSAQLTFSSPTEPRGAAIVFECATDGSTTFTPCTSPVTRTGLGSGAYSLTVRARWQGGEADDTPATASWTVDRTPPETTITAGPSGDAALVGVLFSFQSEANATFQCAIDAGAFTACVSPFPVTVAEGDHTFSVRATDALGNVDSSPATRAYRGIEVETQLDSFPPALSANPDAQITFSSPSAALAPIVFECAADGATTFTACTSPVTRTGLGSGSYSLTVRARWQGGQPDQTALTASWAIDVTPPETTITGGPAGDTGIGDTTFTFASEAGAAFQCRIDSAPFAACTSPAAVTITTGDHTFSVRAVDGLGNTDPSPASRTYRGINTRAAPETQIDSAPPARTNATGATVAFSSPTPPGTDTLAFECSFDGGAFATCTSPVTRTGLAEGNHQVAVRARWVGGETDASPASASWAVDLTAPGTTITAGPSGDTPVGSSSFSFTSDDASATFECSLDSAAFAACTSPHGISVTAGSHTFEVRAKDTAGNVDASPALAMYRGVTGSATRVRLVASNLTSGNQQSYDPGHGARILMGLHPDIVMIQEFNYFPGNDTTEIRNWVTATFGAEFSFYREVGAQIPNGVISRYPILDAGTWQDTYMSNREFAWARIDVPGPKDLWAVSVHLYSSSSGTRNNEAALLRDYINTFVPAGDYVVIGGDFNTGARSEPCISTLSSVVSTSGPFPVDQNGNGNTNSSRGKPYDWVLMSANLKALQVPVVIGSSTYPAGLVMDTRVYTPLSEVAPAQVGDSASSNMQHMGVVVDVML